MSPPAATTASRSAGVTRAMRCRAACRRSSVDRVIAVDPASAAARPGDQVRARHRPGGGWSGTMAAERWDDSAGQVPCAITMAAV